MKTLILGAQGNLGSQLVEVFSAAGHEVVALDRDGLDVLDFDKVTMLIRDGNFGTVINGVAWNDVDGAEDSAKRETCHKMNAELPGVLARAAVASGAAFVHYSTDYVFGGDGRAEYDEAATPCPLNEYGRSKATGEQAALAAGGRVYVCRSSKLFGPTAPSAASKPSFAEVIVKAARTKPELSVVDEEFGCPTYTRDLAEATHRLLHGNFAPGIYHLVNDGPAVTWYGFTMEIFETLGITTPVSKTTSAGFARPAVRPARAVLVNTKFPALPDRRDALRRHFTATTTTL